MREALGKRREGMVRLARRCCLVGLLCVSCTHPLGIGIAQVGGRMVFVFDDCGTLFRIAKRVDFVRVSRRDHGAVVPVCSGYVPPSPKWEYGASVSTCEALQPSTTYELFATAPGHLGTREFQTDGIGKLTPTEPACP